MKKNTMMRIASVLLIAVLMTTCVISGTFAKYITSDSGTDAVRVAKWGFEATANSIVLDDLFKTAYVDNAVKGYADVVAPGTTNSVDFKFEYDSTSNGVVAPEVAYNFTVALTLNDGVTADKFLALDENDDFYWTLDGANYQTFALLQAAVQDLAGTTDGSGSKDYAPNTLPTAFDAINETHTIGWTWEFNGTDNDAEDTAMGNADALANIAFTLTITATQLDNYTVAP